MTVGETDVEDAGISVGSAGILVRGVFAGLNLREPDAVGCTVGLLLIVDVRGIDSVGDSGGAPAFFSRALESDEAVAAAESSTRTVGRVDIAFG